MLHLLIIPLLLSATTMHAEINRAKFITDIANQFCNAQGFKRVEKPQLTDPLKPKFEWPKWEKVVLQGWDKWHLTFDLLNKHLEKNNVQLNDTVDPIFFKKIEFFCGGEVPSNTLFSYVDRTHSCIGKACLSFKFVSPKTDITSLERDQTAVREMVNQNKVRKDLDAAFKAIAEKSENLLLLMWQPSSNLLNESLIQGNYSWFAKLSKNSTYLEVTKRLGQISAIPTSCFTAFLVIAPIISGYAHGRENNTPIISTSLGLFGSAYSSAVVYFIINHMILAQHAERHIEEQTYAIAHYIRQCKKINHIIQSNPVLRSHIPAAKTLHTILSGTKASADFKEVLYNVSTHTFFEEPSFWAHKGRIFATYYMLREIKDELIPLMMAMGEIETYLSAAQLYKEFENKSVRYAFVEFVKNAQTPSMEAIGFWNPFVDPKYVVLNSFTLGQNNTRNAIITGPNTGGKSTVLKALLINMLMAQTLGITPAQEMKCTPFGLINCYLNITDDIATGASLFKAEVLRAKLLINSIKALPVGTFSFTIMDEVFSGTSPQEGEYAAFLFAQRLAEHNNSMTVIATHFAQLTKLPETTNNAYSNHHVEVIRNDDRTLTRTFLLKDGPSFLNVAMDILYAEGVLDV